MAEDIQFEYDVAYTPIGVGSDYYYFTLAFFDYPLTTITASVVFGTDPPILMYGRMDDSLGPNTFHVLSPNFVGEQVPTTITFPSLNTFQYGVAYKPIDFDTEPNRYYFDPDFINFPTTTIRASVLFDGDPIIMYGYFTGGGEFVVTSPNFVYDTPFSITFYPAISASLTWFFSP
jgi:hypothetical protein